MNFSGENILTLQELADKWSKDFPVIITVGNILSYGAKKLLPIYIPISRDRVTICKLISDVQPELVHNYSNTANTVDTEVEKYINEITIYKKDCESDVLGLISLPDLQHLSQFLFSTGESIYLKYLRTEKMDEVLYVLNDYSMYGGGGNVYLKYEYLYVKLEDKQKFEKCLKDSEKNDENTEVFKDNGVDKVEYRESDKKDPKYNENLQMLVDAVVKDGMGCTAFVRMLSRNRKLNNESKYTREGFEKSCYDVYLSNGTIHFMVKALGKQELKETSLRKYFTQARKNKKSE